MGAFVHYQELEGIIEEEKHNGNKIVLTGGCFDLLHEGHLHLLSEARKYGSILVVNVVNDKRVRVHTGALRPIKPEYKRAEMVAALEMVDYTTVHPSVDLGPTTELALLIKPHVMVQRMGKWREQDQERLKMLLGYEVELISVKSSPYKISTSKIIRSIVDKYSRMRARK